MLSWLLNGSMYGDAMARSGASSQDVKLAAEGAVHPLESRIEALELACAGLWELLKTKHGYTNEELVKAVRDVDGRDGAIDGKMRPTGREACPHCHRMLLTRKSLRCNWCGGELGRSPL